MGLLDSLLSGMTSNAAGGQSDSTAQLMQIAMQLLASNGQGGGGGGLGALLQQFQQAGLGDQIQSWIGTGQNMPVSPDQLTQAFGQGSLQQMAAQSGLGVDQVSGGLSQLLPQLIDSLTPQGQVPAGGIDSALSELSRMMPR